mgnify:CR=1 FL=1
MMGIFHDIRYAARRLRKNPGFSLIVVATLALGIGANAAIFALTDRVLLQRLPVRNPDQLAVLVTRSRLRRKAMTRSLTRCIRTCGTVMTFSQA